MVSRGSQRPGVRWDARPLPRPHRRRRLSAGLVFPLATVLLGSACQTDLRGREQMPSQAQHPQPAPPHVGVLADPCSENPDTWQGNLDAWRMYDWSQRCHYWYENAHLPAATTARVV